MEKTPKLSEINKALRMKMAEIVEPFSGVTILPEYQEGNPDASNILLLQAFQPMEVVGEELGGRGSLSRQKGNYLLTASFLKSSQEMVMESWVLADELKEKFRFISLPVRSYSVMVGDPYVKIADDATENKESQSASSANRESITVTVPWESITGGE